MTDRLCDIFILEDCPERIKWFSSTFDGHNIFITDNIDEACDKLRSQNYDLIFIDRDLGHPRGDNGEDVAWIMKEEELQPDACIVVHTVNPRGQRNIKKYLDKYHSDVNMIDFTRLRKMKRKDFGL
jgi:predicted O-methyltransferase YrrM